MEEQTRFETVHVGCFQVSEAWFAPDLRLAPHVHEDPVFAVFLEGSMEVDFARRNFMCTPSTVQIHPSGARHSQRYHGRGARILVLEPDADQQEALRPVQPVLNRIGHFRHGAIANLARRLVREIRRPDDVSSLAIEALAIEMLTEATRIDESERRPGDPPSWFRRAEEMVHERFREKLRISDVAEAVDAHPVHVARVFRERYHVPLGTFIRRLRLEWAATQLLETDRSLSAIALAAGFADQSHFTRAFKRHTGRTPGRFREERS